MPSVDDYALTTAGWKIAAAAHGDGAVTSQGYSVYFYQSAWFAFQWTAGSDSATITAAGYPGTPTLITVHLST